MYVPFKQLPVDWLMLFNNVWLQLQIFAIGAAKEHQTEILEITTLISDDIVVILCVTKSTFNMDLIPPTKPKKKKSWVTMTQQGRQ